MQNLQEGPPHPSCVMYNIGVRKRSILPLHGTPRLSDIKFFEPLPWKTPLVFTCKSQCYKFNMNRRKKKKSYMDKNLTWTKSSFQMQNVMRFFYKSHSNISNGVF